MTRSKKYRLQYLVGDTLGIWLGGILFQIERYKIEDLQPLWGDLYSFLFSPKMALIDLLLWLYWGVLFWFSGYYNKPLAKSRIEELALTFTTLAVGAFGQFLFLVIDDHMSDPSLLFRLFLILFATMFLCVYPLRLIQTTLGVREERDPKNWQKAFLIGTSARIEALIGEKEKLHFIPVGKWEVDNNSHAWGDMRSAIEQLPTPPEALYLAVDQEHFTLLHQLFYNLHFFRLPIKITIDDMMGYAPHIHRPLLWGTPLVEVTQSRMKEWEKNVKWVFDRVASLVALVLLSPLFLIISIAIKRSDPSAPVFFFQERIGKNGKPFEIIKFRTMHPRAEASGPQLSSDHDPRVTPLGRWLRKYRLDEIPQFYNVLRGDMSIVGPRPERAFYIQQILEKAPHYYLLHNVLPGITSWGMVRYGYASTLEEMLERFRYDWLYYENMSLRLDSQVLLFTLSTLIQGKGK